MNQQRVRRTYCQTRGANLYSTTLNVYGLSGARTGDVQHDTGPKATLWPAEPLHSQRNIHNQPRVRIGVRFALLIQGPVTKVIPKWDITPNGNVLEVEVQNSLLAGLVNVLCGHCDTEGLAVRQVCLSCLVTLLCVSSCTGNSWHKSRLARESTWNQARTSGCTIQNFSKIVDRDLSLNYCGRLFQNSTYTLPLRSWNYSRAVSDLKNVNLNSSKAVLRWLSLILTLASKLLNLLFV